MGIVVFLGLYVLPLVVALTIHEFAHALTAEKLGDPTARLQGRLTLNPIKHLDRWGTVVFGLSAFASFTAGTQFVFGWGKPVPVDPYNLENPRRDMGLVAIAGPASNVLTAIVVAVLIRLLTDVAGISMMNMAIQALYGLISISVGLAAFNLIPIHPLDGGKILVALLPERQGVALNNFLYQNASIFGMVFLFLMIAVPGSLSMFVTPVAQAFLIPVNFILSL